MFYANQISGRPLNLPPKTLCLTYDDGPGETSGTGPGPRSLELAQYLSEQKIPATFFLTARHACEFRQVIPHLRALGHLVGNHTVNHHHLPAYLGVGGDVPGELTHVEPLITEAARPKIIFFRPPYGAWSPEVAAALNGNLGLSLTHVGPIHWDVNAEDWNYWLNRREPEECALKYLELIKRQTTGSIVLMHDSTTDIGTMMHNNRTLEMTRILVPHLQNAGYRFIRLDFALKLGDCELRPMKIALRGSNGKYVSPRNMGGGEIMVNSPVVSGSEELRIQLFNHGIVTLQAANGAYLSPSIGGDGKILATAPSPEERNSLVLTAFKNRIALRTFEGLYLAWRAGDGGDQLVATSLTISENALFEFVICEECGNFPASQ